MLKPNAKYREAGEMAARDLSPKAYEVYSHSDESIYYNEETGEYNIWINDKEFSFETNNFADINKWFEEEADLFGLDNITEN